VVAPCYIFNREAARHAVLSVKLETMANPNPSPLTRFKPGNDGNRQGRKAGTRDRISFAFLKALQSDFEAQGAAAIARVRETEPGTYMRVVASLVPSWGNLILSHAGQVTRSEQSISDTTRWLEDALTGRTK